MLDPDHSLQNYLNIFNRFLKPLTPNVVVPDSAVDYRDLVHINREINSHSGICTDASREMLRIVDSLLGGLSEIVAAPMTGP